MYLYLAIIEKKMENDPFLAEVQLIEHREERTNGYRQSVLAIANLHRKHQSNHKMVQKDGFEMDSQSTRQLSSFNAKMFSQVVIKHSHRNLLICMVSIH